MTARLRRQLLRKSFQGEAPGKQLRGVFGTLIGRDVQDSEIVRALLDHGVIVSKEELTKYLTNFRSPYTGLVSVYKFLEALEPEAYDFVFPTAKPVAAADLSTVKKEVPLIDRERDPHMWEGTWLHGNNHTKYNRIGHREVSDQEVRNCLRKALASRISHDGVDRVNVYKELRASDSSHEGMIGIDEFKVFLLRIGLKVEVEGNLERLWNSVTGGADRIDMMNLSEMMSSEFETIPRKSRGTIRDKFKFR
jgi:hypothetical protein